MEILPIEMVERISHNLTAKELAACAAVCRQWRDLFNDDSLWRPRCDDALEETLRTTPPVVEPLFVSPEVEGSTLSPIGQWRLSFMRETHLWNNWRQGNHRKSYIATENDCLTFFISNDLIVQLFGCVLINNSSDNNITDFIPKIKLHSVKSFPPTLLKDTTNEYTDLITVSPFSEQIINNSLILFYHQYIVAFDLDLNSENIINFKFKISLPAQQSSIVTFENWFDLTRTAILGHKLCTESAFETLHVWNIEEGTELKVEQCPRGKPFGFRDVITSKTSENAVIVVSDDVNNRGLWSRPKLEVPVARTYCFHIYNSLELRYLPFTVCETANCITYGCKVHCDYVAIGVNGLLKIYNFKNHNLLIQVPFNVYRRLDIIENCFAFIDDEEFKRFDPESQTLAVVTPLPVKQFKIVSNSIIELYNHVFHRNLNVLKIGSEQRLFPVPYKERFNKINESSSRTITVKSSNLELFFMHSRKYVFNFKKYFINNPSQNDEFSKWIYHW